MIALLACLVCTAQAETLYINMYSAGGGTSASTNRTWNDAADATGLGIKVANMLDKDGVSTVYDIRIIDTCQNGTGGATTTGSGDADWIDEGAISERYWYAEQATDNLCGIRIEDMEAENGNTWYVEVYGHRDIANAVSRVTGVGDTTLADDASFDAQQNTTLVGAFSTVIASGNLDIYVKATESGGFGYVNAIRISSNVDFDEGTSAVPIIIQQH